MTPSLLSFTHLIGMALGIGGATAKLTLLLKCKTHPGFVPSYIQAIKPLTRLIVSGLALLTLSGIGWLLIGYPLTPKLVVKLALVGAIWVIGPLIDKAFEPKFQKLAPASGELATPEFIRAQQRYLLADLIATGLFYVIMVYWVLF
jgi:hypothetical protein